MKTTHLQVDRKERAIRRNNRGLLHESIRLKEARRLQEKRDAGKAWAWLAW